MITTQHPDTDEYPAAFAEYVGRIGDDEDILTVLGDQLDQMLARFESIPESRGNFRYAEGKWSIKEIVGHLSDTERVFAYRALRFGRGDRTPLPSFEDQAYVAELPVKNRTLAEFSSEWGDVRRATISLFRNLPAAAWQRRGFANNQLVSVRALAHVIAGHVRHHAEVLGARYSA
jgi:hypothetical protein